MVRLLQEKIVKICAKCGNNIRLLSIHL